LLLCSSHLPLGVPNCLAIIIINYMPAIRYRRRPPAPVALAPRCPRRSFSSAPATILLLWHQRRTRSFDARGALAPLALVAPLLYLAPAVPFAGTKRGLARPSSFFEYCLKKAHNPIFWVGLATWATLRLDANRVSDASSQHGSDDCCVVASTPALLMAPLGCPLWHFKVCAINAAAWASARHYGGA
jgi:hypothetical protein